VTALRSLCVQFPGLGQEPHSTLLLTSSYFGGTCLKTGVENLLGMCPEWQHGLSSQYFLSLLEDCSINVPNGSQDKFQNKLS